MQHVQKFLTQLQDLLHVVICDLILMPLAICAGRCADLSSAGHKLAVVLFAKASERFKMAEYLHMRGQMPRCVHIFLEAGELSAALFGADKQELFGEDLQLLIDPGDFFGKSV